MPGKKIQLFILVFANSNTFTLLKTPEHLQALTYPKFKQDLQQQQQTGIGEVSGGYCIEKS